MAKTSAKLVIPERIPIVRIKLDTLVAMMAIVKSTAIEIGWFGIVDKTEEDGRHVFTIRDYYLPKQALATAGTCEFRDDLMLQDLLELHGMNGPALAKFWCHSHHSLGTTPSNQDEMQGLQCVMQSQDWYLAGIFNNRNEINITFFDYSTGIKIEDIPYQVDMEGSDLGVPTSEQILSVFPRASKERVQAMINEELTSSLTTMITDRITTMKPLVTSAMVNATPTYPSYERPPYGVQPYVAPKTSEYPKRGDRTYDDGYLTKDQRTVRKSGIVHNYADRDKPQHNRIADTDESFKDFGGLSAEFYEQLDRDGRYSEF